MSRAISVQLIALLMLCGSGCELIKKKSNDMSTFAVSGTEGTFVVTETESLIDVMPVPEQPEPPTLIPTEAPPEISKEVVVPEPLDEPVASTNDIPVVSPLGSGPRLVLEETKNGGNLIGVTVWAEFSLETEKLVADLKDKGFRVSVDYTTPPTSLLVMKRPFITWVDSTDNLRQTETSIDADHIRDVILRNHYPSDVGGKAGKRISKHRSATGTSGTIYDAGYIALATAWMTDHIGEKNKLRGAWRRNGKGKFDILHRNANDWGALAIYGTDGEFSLSANSGVMFDIAGKHIKLAEARLNYRIRNEKIEVSSFTSVDLSLIEPLNTNASASEQDVAFLDPGTILTVFSILKTVWAMLHPELDLELPGSIVLDAWVEDGVIHLEFEEAPYIRAVFIAEWHLGIKSIEIRKDDVFVKFLPQPEYWWPVNSRHFQVKPLTEMPSEAEMKARVFPVDDTRSEVYLPEPVRKSCVMILGGIWVEVALGYTTAAHLAVTHQVHAEWLRLYGPDRHALNVIHTDCHEGRGGKWVEPPPTMRLRGQWSG